MKEDGRENHGQSLFGRLKDKNELWSVLDYIDHLTYFDRVDYNYIYAQLKLVSRTNAATLKSRLTSLGRQDLRRRPRITVRLGGHACQEARVARSDDTSSRLIVLCANTNNKARTLLAPILADQSRE